MVQGVVRRFLSDASYEALLRLADTYGAEVPESVTRDELEEIVQEAEDEWYAEHRESNSHPVRIGESKYNIQVSGMQDPAQEEVELPDSYNETRIVLMLRDPSWAFAYWDIRDSDRTAFQRSDSFEGLTIRVFLLPDPNAGSGEASETFDIPITLIDNRWYINLPSQDVYYRLAIYANDEGGERELALSNVIFVSRSNLAEARNGEEASAADQILAQTGIQDMDLPDSGRRIPQRILDLVDEDLMFN
jgi:hypothetical protein